MRVLILYPGCCMCFGIDLGCRIELEFRCGSCVGFGVDVRYCGVSCWADLELFNVDLELFGIDLGCELRSWS